MNYVAPVRWSSDAESSPRGSGEPKGVSAGLMPQVHQDAPVASRLDGSVVPSGHAELVGRGLIGTADGSSAEPSLASGRRSAAGRSPTAATPDLADHPVDDQPAKEHEDRHVEPTAVPLDLLPL